MMVLSTNGFGVLGLVLRIADVRCWAQGLAIYGLSARSPEGIPNQQLLWSTKTMFNAVRADLMHIPLS